VSFVGVPPVCWCLIRNQGWRDAPFRAGGRFGRHVTIIDDAKGPSFQQQMGVPADLSSWHTAVVDGLLFEGHVPIAAMKRLLAQRPKGIRGLNVAGMPMGSPGMEVPGRAADRYEVIAFGPAGRRVFARH
jgi:hypothetical protein